MTYIPHTHPRNKTSKKNRRRSGAGSKRFPKSARNGYRKRDSLYTEQARRRKKQHEQKQARMEADLRQELAPHNTQRVTVEATLIEVTLPNKRHKHHASLFFGSVYLPKEGIELDHVNILVPFGQYNTLFKKGSLIGTPHGDRPRTGLRYSFTARVEQYQKKGYVLGVQALRHAYMLTEMSHVSLCPESSIPQPTRFVRERLLRIQSYGLRHLNELKEKNYSRENPHPLYATLRAVTDNHKLIESALGHPDNGSIEYWVNDMVGFMQKRNLVRLTAQANPHKNLIK